MRLPRLKFNREVAQNGSLSNDLESLEGPADLKDVFRDFNNIVDMALGIRPARDGYTDQVHVRRNFLPVFEMSEHGVSGFRSSYASMHLRVSLIAGSKHSHMRELRVQSGGHPIRVFYAFDPRRSAILLIGGDKTGNDRFYRDSIPIADKLYDEHLEELRKEGLIP